jgi:hypothetical protein
MEIVNQAKELILSNVEIFGYILIGIMSIGYSVF